MAAVTVSEFASYVQQDVDTATATLLLSLAEGLVVDRIGVLPDPASAATRAAILEATRRAYVNPEGWSSERIDDWQGARDAAFYGVYLTAEEIGGFSPVSTAAFTIRPFGEPGYADPVLYADLGW